MTTDCEGRQMRAWMNLFEETEEWYTDNDLMYTFFRADHVDHWHDMFNYAPSSDLLHVAQDTFQLYMRPETKPAWITDIRIEQLPPPRNLPGEKIRNIYWKVERGEDDPDE